MPVPLTPASLIGTRWRPTTPNRPVLKIVAIGDGDWSQHFAVIAERPNAHPYPESAMTLLVHYERIREA